MIRYESYDAKAASKIIDTVIVPLYEDVYADVLANPFDSTERFTERTRSFLSRPTFAMIVAYDGDEPVGQTYGSNLTSLGPWDKMLTPLPDGFADEYGGTRTFGLTEIMVREPWRRQGIARRIHDMLLAGRPEERAILTSPPKESRSPNRLRELGLAQGGAHASIPRRPHLRHDAPAACMPWPIC